MTTNTAILAGGCFWGVQELIRALPGVISTRVGYTGGDNDHPTYRNHPGHAEAIEITYDPARTDYRALLEFFFQIHDPTTKNRQGNDVGTQYRSVIFWHSPQQKETAEKLIAELNTAAIWDAPIVTELAPFTAFHKAEGYHQQYFRNNPAQPYCQGVVAPKVAKFRKHFLSKLKTA